MLRLLKQPGGHVWVADAPNWPGLPGRDHVIIAVAKQGIEERAGRGHSWQLGQMYGVVGPGLIFAEHVFQGLRREMYVRMNKKAAATKLAVTWAAKRDAQLVGDKYHTHIQFTEPPPNRVFVVYISPNGMLSEYPDVLGWAEHWAWVAADGQMSGAPVEWNDRYDKKLWSRGT